MGLSAFEQPLRLRLGPSRRLAIVLALGHLGGMVAALIPPWPWWAVATLSVVVGGAWFKAHRRLVGGRDGAIAELRLQANDSFEVTVDGKTVAAVLHGAEVVQPWLTVLVFRLADGRRRAAVLLPDNVEPQAFRRLRARLRRGRFGGAASVRDGGS